jgi:putative transposase
MRHGLVNFFSPQVGVASRLHHNRYIYTASSNNGTANHPLSKLLEAKGAFWEDRYHATAIESERHLPRCLVYNTVRTGVVSHPSEWPFGSFEEIQKPRRKCVLIAYQKLAEINKV